MNGKTYSKQVAEYLRENDEVIEKLKDDEKLKLQAIKKQISELCIDEFGNDFYVAFLIHGCNEFLCEFVTYDSDYLLQLYNEIALKHELERLKVLRALLDNGDCELRSARYGKFKIELGLNTIFISSLAKDLFNIDYIDDIRYIDEENQNLLELVNSTIEVKTLLLENLSRENKRKIHYYLCINNKGRKAKVKGYWLRLIDGALDKRLYSDNEVARNTFIYRIACILGIYKKPRCVDWNDSAIRKCYGEQVKYAIKSFLKS